MKVRKMVGTGALFLALMGMAGAGESLALEESGGQKHNGVIYNIADDRQVEKVGGIYEPEGIDKYMKRRFDAMDVKLNDLQSQIAKVQEQMAIMLKKIEELSADEKSGDVLVSGSKTAETRAVKTSR